VTQAGFIHASASAFIAVLALVAPWLLPPQGGPSPSVLPWLLAMGCTGVLAGVLPRSCSRGLLSLWLLAGGLAVLICSNSQSREPLGAASAILLMATCAALAARGRAATEGPTAYGLALAWLVASLVSSMIGLCQYFGLAQHFASWMSPSPAVGEAFANLRQRNQFATLTNIGLAALLWWAAQSRGRQLHVLGRAGLLAAAVLLATGNAASSSRTGLVQLLLLGGLVWLWDGMRWPATRRLVLMAIAAYVIATVALPALLGLNPFDHGMWGRLRTGDSACGSRITLWRNVLHLISQHPWLGWGWGELDYAHFITAYDGPRHCEMLDNAHNLPLHLAVELGLPLALLICGAAAWLIWRARPWREMEPTRQMAWMVLAVILLHSMLEYPLWYGPFQMAFGLSLGLLWRARQPSAPDVSGTVGLGKGRYMLAAALLGSTAYAAWDYHRISQIYLPPEQRSPAYRDNTLEKIRGSWLFREQVRFAEFTLTPLTRDNAGQLNAMAHELLHFSSEARVVEKLIESALLQGHEAEARFFMARYRAAYPQEYARWAKTQA